MRTAIWCSSRPTHYEMLCPPSFECLRIGGKERVALQLALRGREEGDDHRLLLFDTPCRSDIVDLNPGDVPTYYSRRKPGIDLTLPWRIRRVVQDTGACVVHAHNDTAIFYGALALLLDRHRPLKLVGTFHTRPTHGTWRARTATRWAAQTATYVTSVSDELTHHLRMTGWVSRCRTLWNGVDIEKFSPAGGTDNWLHTSRSPTAI